MEDPSVTTSNRPNVTGLSPKEGTPGTQITIRGECLGTCQGDLISVIICGCECVINARWESPHKIVTRIGRARAGAGEVIVATKTGGKGGCAVNFKVFHVQIGALTESAVWVDESRTVPGRGEAAAAAEAAAAFAVDHPLNITTTARRMPQAQLTQTFPESSGNFKMDNFLPAWHLLEHHRGASLAELRRGLEELKAENRSMPSSTAPNAAPRDVVKNNLHSYMACVDALDSARVFMHKRRNHWPLTEKLQQLTAETHRQATSVFGGVLSRKDTADSTRNALSVLTRFQFLFNLPSSIDKHLANNEYGAVMSEYSRAKSLFGDSEQPLFKEAMGEAAKRMDVFAAQLNKQLLHTPSTLEQHKKTIKYLLMLEAHDDPGLECLQAQHGWMEGELWATQTRLGEQARMRAQRSQQMVAGLDASLSDTTLSDVDSVGGGASSTDLPERFEFVECVVQLLADKLVDLHALASAYIDGTLSTSNNLHREAEIDAMLTSLVTLASWMMLNALLPDAVPNTVLQQFGDRFIKWPAHQHDKQITHELGNELRALRSIRASITQLCHLPTHTRALVELSQTLRLQIVTLITHVTEARVFELEAKETWRLHAHDTDYTRTQLPHLFESLVVDMLPVLRQVLQGGHFAEEKALHTAHVQRCMHTLLVSFAHTLVALVKLPKHNNDSSTTQHRPSTLALEEGGDQPQQTVLVKDRKLLIALANCDYVLHFSLARLCDRLSIDGVRETETLRQSASGVYAQQRAVLLKAYTDVKCSPFAALIQTHVYAHSSSVFGVSNYVKDVLLCVVSVQAELFLHAKHFSDQVMAFVVRTCAEQLCLCVQAMLEGEGSSKHDVRQCCCTTQATLDVNAFSIATISYLAPETRALLAECCASMDSHVDAGVIDSCLKEFRHTQRLTLLSLRNLQSNDDDDETV